MPTTTGKKARSRRPAQRGRPARTKSSFPVVAIGASAGGLEAFGDLLKALPLDTGMSFVLIQHLDPQHDSALTQILARATKLPVTEIAHDQAVLPNHVHVIPRGMDLRIEQGLLKLSPRKSGRQPHHPIDRFFESLAEDQREQAIGVVLSGTASDGTLGLESIKAEGGLTFAQDESAKHDSMPRSAIAAGCVDYIFAPAAISSELVRIARHPLRAETDRERSVAHETDATPLPPGKGAAIRDGDGKRVREEAARAPATPGANGYKKVLLMLRSHSGVDFSLYKSSTIQRRINRRMIIAHHNSLDSYAAFLRGNVQELDALYSDVLISVTSFFRNPETFDILKQNVLPQLLRLRGDGPLRCWVFGCSTGQEAYSIAMTFVEAAESAPRMRDLQIFATDLNETLLEKARQGFYSRSLTEEIAPERLRRFFVEEQGGYRITKAIREMVVFARQNLVVDPPFSRMDLISCRNLLIYLEPSLQKKALPTFHYALKPTGFLLLGASESIGGFTDLFETVDKKHKIYARKPAATPVPHLPAARERATHVRTQRRADQHAKGPTLAGLQDGINAQREADRIMISQYAPPGVLVNMSLQIQQFRGSTGAYLQPPAGKATLDVLKMAREGLMLPLRSALQQARKTNKTTRKQNVQIKQDGQPRTVNLEVIPLRNASDGGFLILFEDAARTTRRRPQAVAKDEHPVRPQTKKQEQRRIEELDLELTETREYLQVVQEQHEAANEELQAANEEVQSANEELQSINEELETSKEELESVNEELTTLNEEMNQRNVELSLLNNDLVNLQGSTRLAIVLLGRDLTIRRFSVQAQKQFDLLATDIRRPIAHLRHQLRKSAKAGASAPDQSLVNLDELASEVIASVRESELEVYDEAARRWYQLRIRPYMTLDNKIDGAVLVLHDIDDLKEHEQLILQERDLAESILDTLREPLLLLDGALSVQTANRAFYRFFGTKGGQTVGRNIFELGNGQWDVPRLRELLTAILSESATVEDFRVDLDLEQHGARNLLLNARRLDARNADGNGHIVLVIEDITDRTRALDGLRASHEALEARAEELIRFNQAAVGRELRMIELKQEINILCQERGEPPRYRIDGDVDPEESPA